MSREIPKRSYADLEADLRASPIRQGDIVRHYSGDRYRILGITFDCKTNEMRFTYTKIGRPNSGQICFSRPASDFVAPRFVVEETS